MRPTEFIAAYKPSSRQRKQTSNTGVRVKSYASARDGAALDMAVRFAGGLPLALLDIGGYFAPVTNAMAAGHAAGLLEWSRTPRTASSDMSGLLAFQHRSSAWHAAR